MDGSSLNQLASPLSNIGLINKLRLVLMTLSTILGHLSVKLE